MRKLTGHQKKFLLDCFFEHKHYAGWKTIATELLETGQCVVAGEKCIWTGGIGNFIKTEKANGFVFCTLYKFDLEYFLSSAWYKEVRNDYVSMLLVKKMKPKGSTKKFQKSKNTNTKNQNGKAKTIQSKCRYEVLTRVYR